jgi:nitroreductase/2-polyprenyl-3-methyl-5-hydroxy-6-metoxy-1,4-benzoquinol methylase
MPIKAALLSNCARTYGVLGDKTTDVDEGAPVGPTPPFDFWKALYTRRSIRKFKPDPVARELVGQVLHAGIWAPSSCNYQMWDFVAVDDADVNRRLAALSLQMGNAPVNIVVAYGREFSEEGWANVQSASAAIENMSLAAHVLGLGTFWITQMGDREKVREVVGLPEDRLVVAVLAVGYPKVLPAKGPKRRPMAHVTHWNCYAGRPIPSSTKPEDWAGDLLATYQRARVLNGLRHNKPRAWEERAIAEALARFVPEGRELSKEPQGQELRWLDVLPCTGIVTEKLYRERPGFRFDVVERSSELAEFVAARTRPRAGIFAWPASAARNGFAPPVDGRYDVVSCFFRLENLPAAERARLLTSAARWVKPGGRVLLGYVNRNSFHDLTEWLRGRRGGPRGVEYVLAPDPNIGPFESLEPAAVERMCAEAGLVVDGRLGRQAVPPKDELEFRTRNFSQRAKDTARVTGWLLSKIEKLPALEAKRGRFQFLWLRPPT